MKEIRAVGIVGLGKNGHADGAAVAHERAALRRG
jgi:hypothetical protein